MKVYNVDHRKSIRGAVVICYLLFSACNSGTRYEKEQVSVKDTVIPRQVKTDSVLIKKNDYSVIANGVRISLKDWESDVDLNSLLGRPAAVSTKTLGSGADTHSGSSIKAMIYNGLKLELYIPPSKDSGWIMNMKVSSDKYLTERGAKVGDSVERVKTLYPEGRLFPDGRTDTAYYTWYISNQESVLKLEIDKGLVSEIFIYYEIP
jgi:hypothetical protein